MVIVDRITIIAAASAASRRVFGSCHPHAVAERGSHTPPRANRVRGGVGAGQRLELDGRVGAREQQGGASAHARQRRHGLAWLQRALRAAPVRESQLVCGAVHWCHQAAADGGLGNGDALGPKRLQHAFRLVLLLDRRLKAVRLDGGEVNPARQRASQRLSCMLALRMLALPECRPEELELWCGPRIHPQLLLALVRGKILHVPGKIVRLARARGESATLGIADPATLAARVAGNRGWERLQVDFPLAVHTGDDQADGHHNAGWM